MEQSLDSLKQTAIERLGIAEDGLVKWAQSMRPDDGAKGRFLWAKETTRGANVASTAYMLIGLDRMGLLDIVVDDEDRAAGAEWVKGMCVGDEQYRDPALLDRKSPGWPEDKPWPTPAGLMAINQYAQAVLKGYGDTNLPAPDPPPGIPQSDNPEEAVQWIKTRPWDKNAWGAGSHAQRMATWLLRWHKEGKITLDPLIQALKFFFEIQDPQTGLWGTGDQSKHVRINGTFKLFPLIRESLALPLPHADRIIDQVLEEFYRPDYDQTVGACDEWDNWYAIALALEVIPDYRKEEIMKLAAWRITRVLEVFSEPDGGLSYSPGRCGASWCEFDMAPSIAQSDVMGIGVLSGAICVCVDLLGMAGQTRCQGKWRMREREDDTLRTKIESLVFDN